MGSDAVMASAYFYYLVALATVVLMSAASPITFGEADVAESETDINSFVPEMELASAAEAVETERTRHIVANIIKSGHNIDVPVNQLQVNSKWLPHQLVKPFFRIDTANKYICWPTSCKKAKCGPNTPVNAAIAKKQVAKLSKAGCLAEKFKREMKKVKAEQINAKLMKAEELGMKAKVKANELNTKELAAKKQVKVHKAAGNKKQAELGAKKANELKTKEVAAKKKEKAAKAAAAKKKKEKDAKLAAEKGKKDMAAKAAAEKKKMAAKAAAEKKEKVDAEKRGKAIEAAAEKKKKFYMAELAAEKKKKAKAAKAAEKGKKEKAAKAAKEKAAKKAKEGAAKKKERSAKDAAEEKTKEKAGKASAERH